MNPIKTMTLTLTAIITIAMMLTVIQFVLRKLKPRSEADSRIKSAYGIWFGCLLTAAFLISAKAILFLEEAVDNVSKIATTNLFFEIVKTSALYIGLSSVWLLLCLFIAKVLTIVMLGVRQETEEMELNNTCYFLIRGLAVNGLVFCLGPVLDIVFRMVMPNVPLPFYH
jgi:hypothetical protein